MPVEWDSSDFACPGGLLFHGSRLLQNTRQGNQLTTPATKAQLMSPGSTVLW